MSNTVMIKAPAKINLGLAVLRRRPDGYHDLESVMQQVSLSDTLVLEPRRSPGWSFDCPDRPLAGPENLGVEKTDVNFETWKRAVVTLEDPGITVMRMV